MNTYFSIEEASEGYFEDKGSKFLAFAFACQDEDKVKEALNQIKNLHPKASHHCYAYRLGTDKNNYRANDDGEPSGSAGRPILGQIDSFNLSNVFVVVVRYYGGTNLGVSGLISAYKAAARDAFQNTKIVEKDIEEYWQVTCSYLEVNDLFNFLKKIGVESWQEEYTDFCKINFSIPLSKSEVLSSWLNDLEINYQILETK